MEKEKSMGNKWQRLMYMPCVPLGEDGRRVTGSKEHIEISRRAATEGMVLLKNNENVLPIKNGAKLALFGKSIADYVKGGGGSGDTTVAYVRSLLEGLKIKESEGKVSLFAPSNDFYEENVKKQYADGIMPGRTVEPKVSEELIDAARNYTDTALISICRFSGEDYDRTGDKYDGDFYLSHEEEDMVNAVLAKFDKVIIVLNTGGMMDTSWFKDDDRVKSALLAWQAGMEGGLATADILVGDVVPSGHLTDTFAVDFDSYPSSYNYNESDDYVEYTEDIYVGYRYFETIKGAKEKVAYPFGYGLNYTEMNFSDVIAVEKDGKIEISAKISNVGNENGKEVLQVYCSAPQGKLYKPAKVLCGFKKTALLKPGQSEEVNITIDPYSFASYDDTGRVAKSAYVLEAGDYYFSVGFNVRDTEDSGFVYSLKEDQIVEQLSEKCKPHQLKKRLLSDGSYEELETDDSFVKYDYDLEKLPPEGVSPAESKWKFLDSLWAPRKTPALIDVYEGKMTMDDFMALLTDEQKICLLGGQPNRGPANTWGFGNLPMYGVPNIMTADGPAGLRIWPECGVNTTAFPCATLLACTWNPDVLYEVGSAGAFEVYENGIGIWLTPAINIHRTPLCGRNFEYYSEDPFLAGTMATAMVKGIQSRGIAASVKHFACNNKEKNRRNSDSRVSERALREIYLKAFEMCVKEAQPHTIMSAYNGLNGQRTSTNKELLTDILRNEWGFKGLVTSDWNNFAEHYKEINAGNDIKMGIGMPQECMEALKEGKLDIEAVNTSVRRLFDLFMKLN